MSKASQHNKQKSKPSIGIALGGGGLLGGIYVIGALRALDECLEGLDLNDLDVYVGVNTGSFVAANLANQMTSAQMCRIFVRNEADVHPFHPQVFYRPAFSEYFDRCRAIPKLLFNAWINLLSNPNDQSVLESLTVLAQVVPSGIFDNEGFHQYLARSYSSIGRTNDFRLLRKRLIIMATDLETGRTIRFGEEGFKTIPISKAIQSSMAAPGIYKPVEVGGHYYVDGTLNKGMHATVAIDHGADIVLAINPVVPIDVPQAVAAGTMSKGDLARSGMPNVLSQSYRTMVYSRLRSGMRALERDFPDTSVLLIEPTRSDADLFFSSAFSFKARKRICENAYLMTRATIRERASEFEKILQPAGVRIRHAILDDETRTLSTGLYGETLPVYHAQSLGPKHTKEPATESYLERVGHRVAALF